MKNINDTLDELIIKYKIDRFHPRFSEGRQARMLLIEFMGKYKDKELILIASSKADINYLIEDCHLKMSKYTAVYYNEMENYDWGNVNKDSIIILASYYSRREKMSWLYTQGIQAISIYDFLACNGVVQPGNYYDIFGEEHCDFRREYTGKDTTFDYSYLDMNSIFFYDRRGYENSTERSYSEMYLARMIFDCVCVKDWELVDRYIQEYVNNEFLYSDEYKQFNREIKKLLSDIKEELKARKQEDVIMFWVDALEYGDDQNMPFLRSLSDVSVDFMNAYTVTPYTHPTAKTLFGSKFALEDKSYNLKIDKSLDLIRYIEDEFGTFCFYTDLAQVDSTIKGRLYQNEFTSYSEIYWNGLSDILQSEKRMFAVLHGAVSTHPPYGSFGLTGEEYYPYVGSPFTNHRNYIRMNVIRQKEKSREYADRVLGFYSDIFPDSTYKIYMSDHGLTVLGRFHAIFRVVQKDIVPYKEEGLFSYINFDKFIYKMLRKESDYSDITDEYIRIQDVDFYDKDILKNLLHRDTIPIDRVWGYQGVISRDHCYFRYNDGEERYCNNDFDGEKLTKDSVNYLRELCADYPKELILDDKFKYTRNVYATLENYNKRNAEWEEKKIQTVKNLFDEISQSERIALRGGGAHTIGLWFKLDHMQQKKIDYVIDANKRCAAARLGLKVIDIDQIDREKIDVIVISSFEWEEKWAEELERCTKGCRIIRLYDYLADKGVDCIIEFYKKQCTKEDMVWVE